MAVGKRSNGTFMVFVYDPSIKKKRYVGQRDTEAEAKRLEEVMKATLGTSAHREFQFSLEHKGEPDCRNCGRDAECLHHIVPQAAAPERIEADDPFLNGIPLCKACHVGWHRRSVRIGFEKLLPEEYAFAVGLMGRDWLDANYPGGQPLDVDKFLLSEAKMLRARIRELEAERDELLWESLSET